MAKLEPIKVEISRTEVLKNQVRIPTSFEIGGQSWKVVKKESMGTVYGSCIHNACEIQIAENYECCPIAEDAQVHTFFHEMLHATLDLAGENDLRGDEKFVNRMATLIHQVFKSAKYELDPQ